MAVPNPLSIGLPFAVMKHSIEEHDTKKPRRSERLSSQTQTTPLKEKNKSYLPSPLTHQESTKTEDYKELTASPPESRLSQIRHRTPPASSAALYSAALYKQGLSSPPSDTQAYSQFLNPSNTRSYYEVEDEEAEGVWGYLVPVDRIFGDPLVCRARAACPAPYPNSHFGKGTKKRGNAQTGTVSYVDEEKQYESEKRVKGFPGGGYIIGRHPECGMQKPLLSGEGFQG